jgi:hypothetical protein
MKPFHQYSLYTKLFVQGTNWMGKKIQLTIPQEVAPISIYFY